LFMNYCIVRIIIMKPLHALHPASDISEFSLRILIDTGEI